MTTLSLTSADILTDFELIEQLVPGLKLDALKSMLTGVSIDTVGLNASKKLPSGKVAAIKLVVTQ